MGQRIVHVITRLLQGGAEENTVATCLHQATAGHSVTLIHGETNPAWRQKIGSTVKLIEVPSLRQPISPIHDLAAVFGIRRVLRAIDPDIVHTHQSKAGIVGRIAAALARTPLIVHTIHIAPFLNVGRVQRLVYLAAEKLCTRLTHVLIAVSDGMRRAFEDAGISDEVAVIHSGMALEKFRTAQPPENWAERIGGWPGEHRPYFVLMLASFEPRKRQLQFIRAIAAEARKRPDVCFLLAGEGPQLTACKDEAERLGVSDKLRFLGHDDRPHELIALADLCVLTSEREGLPRSVIQYIAGGKPVVATGLPGLEEIIRDGENGIVADPNDIEGLAAKIFQLLDDQDERQRLSAAARSTDVSSWSEEAMGEAIRDAYTKGFAGHGRKASSQEIDTIEFFGVPGAGKTSVARELISLLGRDGLKVQFSGAIMNDDAGFAKRSFRRLILTTSELCRHPRMAVRRSMRVAGLGGAWRDKVHSLWNYCSVLAMTMKHRRRGGSELLVCDQGMMQAVWSGRMGARVCDAVSPAKAMAGGEWFRHSLVVHLAVGPEIAQPRLERRGRKSARIQRRTGPDLQRQWELAQRIDRDIADEVRGELRRCSLEDRFLELPNSGDQSPAEIAQLVLHRWRSSAALASA